MELKILDCFSARKFEPIVTTATMRIYSRDPFQNYDYGQLKESFLYVAQFRYVFDDSGKYVGIAEHKKSSGGSYRYGWA